MQAKDVWDVEGGCAGHWGGFWEQVMPSGTTTADRTSAGEGDRRSLQWRGCRKP